MHVVEHLERATEPLISFEIIPPRRGGSLPELLQLIEDLVAYKPPFIDITSHPAEMVYEDTGHGIERRVKRKRPGTLGVCALIQNKYGVDAVPHVLCKGFTREETEDFMIEVHYLGIENVLAIRGDDSAYEKTLQHGRTSNRYAIDLVSQIKQMNEGAYLAQLADAHPTNFCVGVAGYPEKHEEAPNLDHDVKRTKEKVDAGAQYIVTQMFFENRYYFEFVKRCRAAGIEVPIIPGIKILTTKRHLNILPKIFNCELPTEFVDEVESAKKGQVTDVGLEWARKQAEELLSAGVPGVHLYVMQNSNVVQRLMKSLNR